MNEKRMFSIAERKKSSNYETMIDKKNCKSECRNSATNETREKDSGNDRDTRRFPNPRKGNVMFAVSSLRSGKKVTKKRQRKKKEE